VVWESPDHVPGRLIAEANAMTFPAKRVAGHRHWVSQRVNLIHSDPLTLPTLLPSGRAL